jgi:hypothetical protein
MTDGNDENQELVVANGVDDAVVTDSDAQVAAAALEP